MNRAVPQMSVLNLGLRFLLEVFAIIGAGMWGATLNFAPYILAGGIPLIMIVLWGVFAVKDDPSRSGKTVVPTPGWIRLILELLFFGFSIWCFYDMDYSYIALGYIGLVVVHYIISYRRIVWLIHQ